MQRMTSSSSVSTPKEASHHEELFMQQRLLFSENVNELKNLRKQLYSAAEYFEKSYSKEDQKQLVVETLKDYVIKAVINTVDHLGSMAYKVNGFMDEQVRKVSETEHRLSCIEQRLKTCQGFIDQGGFVQHSLPIKFPKHHKRYIIPVGGTMDALGQSAMVYQSAEEDLFEINTATTRETSPTIFSSEYFALHSPQSSPGALQFPRFASKHEKRAVSPNRFPLRRCGTVVKRSLTMNCSSSVIQRVSSANCRMLKNEYPSEPRTRRSISLSLHGERDRTKDTEQHLGKNRRLKALLSLRKSRNDAILYKYLDEN